MEIAKVIIKVIGQIKVVLGVFLKLPSGFSSGSVGRTHKGHIPRETKLQFSLYGVEINLSHLK
jgi:hypothetical protein